MSATMEKGGNDHPEVPNLSALGRVWRDGLLEHQFLLQSCSRCGEARWYPRSRCPACGSDDSTPLASNGLGTIVSLSRIAVNAEPDFERQLPYVVALVNLAEGPTVVVRLVDQDADRCVIGATVEPDWSATGDLAPRFRLRSEDRGR